MRTILTSQHARQGSGVELTGHSSTLLTRQRAMHCRGVALFMYEYAPVLGLDARESALCGWLHDFGYLFGDNRTHAESCGLLLEQVGYRDWRQVAVHGDPQGLSTPLGVLLNIADMWVSPQGERIGFDARLADVAVRYGADSPQYGECSTMVSALRETDEWKLLAPMLESAQ